MENDGDDRENRRRSFLKYAAQAAQRTSYLVNQTIPILSLDQGSVGRFPGNVSANGIPRLSWSTRFRSMGIRYFPAILSMHFLAASSDRPAAVMYSGVLLAPR